jgi:hypothetical protein
MKAILMPLSRAGGSTLKTKSSLRVSENSHYVPSRQAAAAAAAAANNTISISFVIAGPLGLAVCLEIYISNKRETR